MKLSSNLPPGVSEGMIPGNRPQDFEFDKIVDTIANALEDLLDLAKHHDMRDAPDILRALLEEHESYAK